MADAAVKLEAQIKAEAGQITKNAATLRREADAAFARNDFRTGLQLLGHQVFQVPPSGLPAERARDLLLDDDHLLWSSGRRLWTRELTRAGSEQIPRSPDCRRQGPGATRARSPHPTTRGAPP